MNQAPVTTPLPDATRWRHRVLGALLAGACADGVCQALSHAAASNPAHPEPVHMDDITSPHSRGELTFGPITDRAIILAQQLLRRHDAAADSPGACAVADSMPAAWITAVGLQGVVPLTAVAAEARRVATTAGADDIARDVTAAQAVAVALTIRATTDVGPITANLVRLIGTHCETPALRDTIQMVGSLARHRAGTGDFASHFAGRHPQVEGFAVALFAFLTHPDDPREATRQALRQTHAGSPAAIMAATLAGARAGDDHAPQGWGSRLRHSQRILTVGEDLAHQHCAHPATEVA